MESVVRLVILYVMIVLMLVGVSQYVAPKMAEALSEKMDRAVSIR